MVHIIGLNLMGLGATCLIAWAICDLFVYWYNKRFQNALENKNDTQNIFSLKHIRVKILVIISFVLYMTGAIILYLN